VRGPVAAAAGLLALGVLVGEARRAAAQSFVEYVSDDPCGAARALDAEDTSPQAEHLRRACRLQAFEDRLAAERRQELAAQSKSREQRIAAWAEATQPTRGLRPIAVEGYLATGVSTYGIVVSWNVLRRLELDARIGWRKMTCWDMFSADGGDCTRRALGGGARWFLTDRDVSPFVSGGFQVVDAHLQILQPTPEGGSKLLTGNGRGHSVNAGAGLQLAMRWLRMSAEYVYEYVYYTGANQDDMQMTPSPDLAAVWHDSLHQDRHGFRFEVGYAF
jgi:hypothetical protein